MLWVTAALGACFVGVRWGLRDAPVLWFAALRALLGGAVLAVVAVVQRRPLPRSGGIWAGIGVLGFVNVTVAFAAMFAGIAGVATGTAAVLANAQPLLILLPAWWLYGEKLSGRAGIALAVGFGGLMVVALPGGGGRGALLSLLSAVAVTSGTLMVRHLRDVDVVVASAAHFLFGGAVLAVIGTAAAFLVWFVEAQRCALASLTAWIFLVPVFGLLIGFVVLGERPDVWTVSGIALVLLSMRVALTQPGAAGTGPGHLHALNRAVDAGAAPAGPGADRPPIRRPGSDSSAR